VITWVAADEFQQEMDDIKAFLEKYGLDVFVSSIEGWFPSEKYM
jgi:hypothetical protein